jgi:hypothetical protein
MGKCEKYVHDHFQIFTNIRGPKVRNTCKIPTIQLTTNKVMAKKQADKRNPGRTIVAMAFE